MAESETCLIVGASMAGGRGAEALRQAGFDGRIILAGEEPQRPYNRPPLSKELLVGDYPEEKLYFRPPEYYEQQNIELRLGIRATALDIVAREVEFDSGDRIGFDKLLIATGVRLRRLRIPGADLAGIHYLRTIRDAEGIRAELAPGRHVVVVGAGFIGCEIAAACRQRGLDVTMIELLPVPLQLALGEEVGRIIANIHTEEGVKVRTGDGVKEFRGNSRVREVITSSGVSIPCDFAVVGVGVIPETDWLAGSGITLDNGVVVDEYCQTNVPGIYAAGDVANWWWPSRGERLRVEHETNAQAQAVAAARNMAGQQNVYDPVPFVWSDQYDLQLRYVGHASHWDTVVLRGDVEGRSFSAFYLNDGRIDAAFTVNRNADMMAARRLVQARATASAVQLSDESIDLRTLVPKRG
jgi:3-phenylpropionate/trans-cinnamate dioxygenase ferredoxin reductase subunit